MLLLAASSLTSSRMFDANIPPPSAVATTNNLLLSFRGGEAGENTVTAKRDTAPLEKSMIAD
jgi:hypothetical protein